MLEVTSFDEAPSELGVPSIKMEHVPSGCLGPVQHDSGRCVEA